MFSVDLVENKIKSLTDQKNEIDEQMESLKNYQIELLRNIIKDVWVVYRIDKDVTTFIEYFLSEKEAKEYAKEAKEYAKEAKEYAKEAKEYAKFDWKYKKVGNVDDPILYELYKKYY